MIENGKSVITPNEVKKHTINRYQFKGMGQIVDRDSIKNSNSDDAKKVKQTPASTEENNTLNSIPMEEEVNLPVVDKKVLDVIDAILKNSEELAENLQRVEDKLEEQQGEFKQQIEEAKKNSYDLGFKDGVSDTEVKLTADIEGVRTRLIDGINNLDSTVIDFKNLMNSLEKELSQVALDISQEVILSEVSENSEEIAKELAKSLLDNVRGATKVTIKVNPEDAKEVTKAMKDELNIEIEPNNAIAKGGVVIVSDAGNIDGSVMTRFANIKASIQEVQNESESS